MAERYTSSAENVAALRAIAAGPVSVGTFSEAPGVAKAQIGCAAMSISPPDELTFADYVRTAFVAELKMANLYSQSAAVVISGKLISVSVDASALSFTGRWNFMLELSSNGRTLSAADQHTFRSQTLNMTACEGASHRLGDAVQNLISKIVQSPDFPALLEPAASK